MPPAALDAFRDHGRVRPTLTENVEEAISIVDLVARVGIPFQELTDKLLAEGVKQFADAFDKRLKATDRNGKARGELVGFPGEGLPEPCGGPGRPASAHYLPPRDLLHTHIGPMAAEVDFAHQSG